METVCFFCNVSPLQNLGRSRQRHSIGKAIMAGTKPVVLCDNETLESCAGTHSGPKVQGDWNRPNGAKKIKLLRSDKSNKIKMTLKERRMTSKMGKV